MTEVQIPARDTSKYAGQYAATSDPMRLVEIFSDSYRVALSSKNPDTAHDRFALAVEAYHQIMSMSVAGEVRASLLKDMSALAQTFEVQVVINEALGLREKARRLKTARKQIELLARAVDLLERGHNTSPESETLRIEVQETRAELARTQAAAPRP
jgi:carbamoylphosphate synthase large subunit